ncbi:ribosomal RNA large subunit methyltransferase H [Campylobacterota bacterium]|nr:ribosomal RNA large subunit methyltransferase H [Campylobacterota bacterium]
MNITVYYIDKRSSGTQEEIENRYVKLIGSFAQCELVPIYNSAIEKAQKISKEAARLSYTEAFKPYLGKAHAFALDEKGKEMNSVQFSVAFGFHTQIAFFVGGTYGFEAAFKAQCREVISLSKMTFSHSLARIVLCEQIYRALTIQHNHPYHKE